MKLNDKRPSEVEVPDDLFVQWQGVVDTIAKLAKIPACLIMRIAKENIQLKPDGVS